MRQHLAGRKRYPLVLMLEPLFRCNLACAGCGKIDYPEPILNQRMPVADALGAIDECGAPVVVLAGGEPLLHKDLPEIVRGAIAAPQVRHRLHQRAAAEKTIDQYRPSRYFNWSNPPGRDRQMHDKSVCQKGVYDRAVSAIRAAKQAGSGSTSTARCSTMPTRSGSPGFSDMSKVLGVDGIQVLAGLCLRGAPDQKHFLNRTATKELFRSIFGARATGAARNPGRFSNRACSSISWPATRRIAARPGATPPARSSAGNGPATCWAR